MSKKPVQELHIVEEPVIDLDFVFVTGTRVVITLHDGDTWKESPTEIRVTYKNARGITQLGRYFKQHLIGFTVTHRLHGKALAPNDGSTGAPADDV